MFSTYPVEAVRFNWAIRLNVVFGEENVFFLFEWKRKPIEVCWMFILSVFSLSKVGLFQKLLSDHLLPGHSNLENQKGGWSF